MTSCHDDMILTVFSAHVVDVIKEPLLLYKLLTTSTSAGCTEPPSAEAADSSHARGHLPDLSYDDSQYSLVILHVEGEVQHVLLVTVLLVLFVLVVMKSDLFLLFIGGFSYTS